MRARVSRVIAGAMRIRHHVLQAAAWRILVPWLRLRARRRIDRLRPGEVTVVTVNWNSWPYLEVLLGAVRRRSPAGTRILVVDNRSTDESRSRLRRRADVRGVRLPVNFGHDVALDVGFLLCETEFVVALDVDAFPLHDRWLDELLQPLASGTQISGARLNRNYVHPCCLAMRTARFVQCRHSFRSHYQPRVDGRDASGDVGEEMSGREAEALTFFDPTSQRGPGDVGTVFGDLVYHNFYATRFSKASDGLIDGIAHDDAADAWHEALDRFGL
jgi:glycosyltransferase involved in cell wall biosynthesis